MKDHQIQSHLEKTLEKLTEMQRRVVNTTGYTEESRKLKILEELIKEQLHNENSRSATRAVR